MPRLVLLGRRRGLLIQEGLEQATAVSCHAARGCKRLLALRDRAGSKRACCWCCWCGYGFNKFSASDCRLFPLPL